MLVAQACYQTGDPSNTLLPMHNITLFFIMLEKWRLGNRVVRMLGNRLGNNKLENKLGNVTKVR
jgi:hypothetical protein